MPKTKERPAIIQTPEGIAIYPKLTEPDTKFKEDGEYSVQMKFTPEDEAKLLETVQPFYDQSLADALTEAQKKAPKTKSIKAADAPWKSIVDEEGEDTGQLKFTFKMKASGTSKKTGKRWTNEPTLMDADAKVLNGQKATLDIGGGSRLIVAFTPEPWFTALGAGLTLRLEAVQIIDLKSWKQKDASAFGFKKQDGYKSTPDSSTDAEDGEDTAEDNEDDF